MKRTPARINISLAAGAAVLAFAWGAHAQEDLEYAMPDVLLLIDTSGSMARTTVRDPLKNTEYKLPICGDYESGTTNRVDLEALDFAGDTPPDRWSILVDVLTGRVRGHSCAAQQRNTTAFVNEFRLDTTEPYDKGYYLPFNRIVAQRIESGVVVEECTPAPSWDTDIRTALANNAIRWPSTATGGPIFWKRLSDGAACTFDPQDDDGIIDQFQQKARFGLMTFDTKPHWLQSTGTKSIGTGITSGEQASYPGGVGDTWSYFPNWLTSTHTGYTCVGGKTNCGVGWPGGCEIPLATALLEVGARNPAAPPWEGRLMDFGNPLADTDEIVRNNERVQQALSAIRPYGATPIAGMLEDAAYFLIDDNTLLSDTDGPYFWGGKRDPAVSTTPGDGCRKRFVILITDGGPNLDLRPECNYTVSGIAGNCPYPTPVENAELLADNNVPVYVIGFSLNTVGGTSNCTDLLGQPDPCNMPPCTNIACPTGTCSYGYCISNPEEETRAACCTIKAIAEAGGTEPQFAEKKGDLKAALHNILESVDTGTRTRSQPVFATGNAQAGASSAFAAAQFLNSFNTATGDLLTGILERRRYVCENDSGVPEPVPQTIQSSDGDNFHENVDDFRTNRLVYTVVAEEVSSKIPSEKSLRPRYTETYDDGLGKLGVTEMVDSVASAFANAVDERAVIDSADCTATSGCCFTTTNQPSPSVDDCSQRFLNLQLGLPTGNADIDIEYQRASAFGAIVRSTPVLAGPPQDYLRDESYMFFQQTMSARPSVLYAPTTDGQLHAFSINVTNKELNELWAFMPPAVLPRLKSQFPTRYAATNRDLLDGPIVIRNVVGSGTDIGARFLYRTKLAAMSPSGSTTRWYTVLVGAFGSNPGYYAIDVTWPDPSTTPPTGYTAGPRFLWQLTTDENGAPLFGTRSATPTITTLFFAASGEEGAPAEHAVAILPGGYGGERKDEVEPVRFDPLNVPGVDDRVNVRPDTRVYTPSEGGALALGGARSITIVRLDTGEIVRTFRRSKEGVPTEVDDNQVPPTLDLDLVTPAPLDAPIVGHVIAYPSGAGAVSDRAYVGDAEGRFWRLDLTSVDPKDWSVGLFHDAYPATGSSIDTGFDYTAAHGSPIQTPPILSTDPIGRVTLAFSTGDQRTVKGCNDCIYPACLDCTYPVWSLTEVMSETGPKARVNWFLGPSNAVNPSGVGGVEPTDPHFDKGERVTGPMSLFDSVLYFTSYDPSQEDPATCAAGKSYLWGVHYINAGLSAAEAPDIENPNVGPMPWLAPDDEGATTIPTPAEFMRVDPAAFEMGTVAYGVGVTAKPACYILDEVAADPFLGFGTHKSVTSVTPAQFQLIVQSGRGGETLAGGQTKVTTRTLLPPLGGGRIDSWAAILE